MASSPSVTNPLASPVGHYQSQVLLLAPESGEDAFTKSLLAQFLQLGVSVELDEHWHVPTKPPRDLSAYKVCCFPATATKYEADLSAFFRGGGFLPFTKYYPVESQCDPKLVHPYPLLSSRDVYAWTLANSLLEGGLTLDEPGFARTMEARAVDSMLADHRVEFFSRHKRPIEVWHNWADPAYAQFRANLVLAEQLGDYEWLDLMYYCLDRVCASKDEMLSRRFSETKTEKTADHYVAMMASLLMERGEATRKQLYTDTGVELMRFFLDNSQVKDGTIVSTWMNALWSENTAVCPGLFWLARVTGEEQHAVHGANTVRQTAAATHHSCGLWHHWENATGRKGAFWSRATQWPLLWMTQSLPAVDPSSEISEFMRNEIAKTFAGLERFQDPEKGLWHLVMDEALTPIETSASGTIIYCYERLREAEMIPRRYDEMIERAFVGMKRLYYRGGFAGCCRGTGFGVPHYYRSRPMGYFNCNFGLSAFARRTGNRFHKQM